MSLMRSAGSTPIFTLDRLALAVGVDRADVCNRLPMRSTDQRWCIILPAAIASCPASVRPHVICCHDPYLILDWNHVTGAAMLGPVTSMPIRSRLSPESRHWGSWIIPTISVPSC